MSLALNTNGSNLITEKYGIAATAFTANNSINAHLMVTRMLQNRGHLMQLDVHLGISHTVI